VLMVDVQVLFAHDEVKWHTKRRACSLLAFFGLVVPFDEWASPTQIKGYQYTTKSIHNRITLASALSCINGLSCRQG
jgi:hypothetical protein